MERVFELEARGELPAMLEDAIAGLKEALIQGTTKGVNVLSVKDGFFKEPSVKILFPPEAQKIEKTLRDIAPFTQVFFHLQTKTIIQIDWDGLSLKKQNISMYSPFLICSNSLYDQKTQTELKTHFINQNSTNADEDVSSSFHKRNLFYRNHPIYLRKGCDIQTVSITKIVKNMSGFVLEYKDVLNRKTEILQL